MMNFFFFGRGLGKKERPKYKAYLKLKSVWWVIKEGGPRPFTYKH